MREKGVKGRERGGKETGRGAKIGLGKGNQSGYAMLCEELGGYVMLLTSPPSEAAT